MLIGAADLATETLGVAELSAFLSGSTDQLFIKSEDDLKRAMTCNHYPAQDGLYPILDYYCHDDTWQPTIKALMSSADKVVLDLRGFTGDNMGIQFEIEELVKRVNIEVLTVLIDEKTDTLLAESLFLKSWYLTNENQTDEIVTLPFQIV